MTLLVQLDGLLRRFGRVVPDSIAMIESVRHIQSRLRPGGKPDDLQLRLFRLGGDHSAHGSSRASDNRVEDDDASLLGRYFGFAGAELEIADDCLALAQRQVSPKHDRPLILTTSFETYDRCRETGIEVVRIGDRGTNLERWAPYLEVQRLLEERLRIPTARPMRAAVRTGGLLAIHNVDPAAASERALQLIRIDPNCDWVILDNELILYTEDPDLEDELAAENGVERLSYAVNKQAIVLSQSDKPHAGTLHAVGRFALSADSEPADVGEAGPEPWHRVRRRVLSSEPIGPGSAAGRRGGPPLTIPTAAPAAIPSALDAGPEQLPRQLRHAISSALERNVSPDCLCGKDQPRAVTWMTPFGTTKRTTIVVFVYQLPVSAASQKAPLTAALSGILAVSQWLESQETNVGVLHCLVLDQGTEWDRLLGSFLFEEELNNLSHIVLFRNLTEQRDRIEARAAGNTPGLQDLLRSFHLEVSAVRDPQGSQFPAAIPRFELSGGNWCHPITGDTINTIERVLRELVG